MAIDAPEFQQEVNEFLRDTKAQYEESFERIHSDYRAQVF